MATRQQQDEILAQAEKFLEEYGAAPYIQKLLDSDEVKSIVHQIYLQHQMRKDKLRKSVPEALREHAESVLNEFDEEYTEEVVLKDLKNTFKIRMHAFLAEICSEEELKSYKQNNTFYEEVFVSIVGKTKSFEELAKIAQELQQITDNILINLIFVGSFSENEEKADEFSRENKEPEEILEAAEAFFAKYGLTEVIQNFVNSDEVREVTDNAYSKLIERIAILKQNAPEDLTEHAEKLYKEFEYMNVEITEILHKEFKTRIHNVFGGMPKSYFDRMFKSGAVASTFVLREGKILLLNDIRVIGDEVIAILSNKYLSDLYEGYIPKELPEPIETFLKGLSEDYTIVPLTAIAPFLTSDDCDEESSDDENFDE